MYLLYLDESGNESDPSDRHFVLGGAAVFERHTVALSQALDAVQAKHFPGIEPIEFHAAQIRSGSGFWRKVERQTRTEVLTAVAEAIATTDQGNNGMVLFAAAIEKDAQLHGERAVETATEQVLTRFDKLLRQSGQRGLVIFAEGRFDTRAKVWVRNFREIGTRWGVLRNLSDIPYFASVRETRLLQVADFVAHAVFRLYDRGDCSLIGAFAHRFHQRDGVLHGLRHHRCSSSCAICECPACYSRAHPGHLGPLVTGAKADVPE
ncbi:MAG TPA: DUF3800 domain-containing protein [Terriglobales bacterium]